MASGGPPDISYSGQDQDNSGHELGPAYLLQNIPMSSQARMQMLVGEEFVCVCVCVCGVGGCTIVPALLKDF